VGACASSARWRWWWDCLGVLKAGGAYLPPRPELPAKSGLSYMLCDARRALVLVTQAALVGRLPERPGRVARLDEDWGEITRQPATAPASGIKPDNLAYVIYTSGSTR